MFQKIVMFCIFLSFFCFQETIVSAKNGEKQQLTLELMKKSGLNQQIANKPEALNADVANNFKYVLQTNDIETNRITKQLTSMVSKSFKPEIIKSIVSAHIEAELDIKDIKAVLSWLNSPLGKKITRIEEESSTAEAFKSKLILLPLLKQKNDYKKRLKLMQDIDQHMKATESALKDGLRKQKVSFAAMSSAFPMIRLPEINALQEDLKTYSHIMKKRVADEITMNLLYCYRQLNIYEIEKYIAFTKTDFGKRYHDVVNEGLQKAHLFCGKEFGKKVGEMLAKESSQKFRKPDIQTYPQRK